MNQSSNNGSGAGVGVLAVLTEAESWLPLDHYEDERFHERYLQAVKAIESAMALPGKWRDGADTPGNGNLGYEWRRAQQSCADELEAALGPAPPAADAPEPVAWLIEWSDPSYRGKQTVSFDKCEDEDGTCTPLYATPPSGGGDADLSKLADEMQRQHDDGRAPWIGPNDIATIRRLASSGGDAARFVPGVMHCAKCKFRLARTNLYVRSGTTGPGDNKSEPCPNGCGPLWPVTWEQEAREAMQLVEELSGRLASGGGAPTPLQDEVWDFITSTPGDVTHQRLLRLGWTPPSGIPGDWRDDIHLGAQMLSWGTSEGLTRGQYEQVKAHQKKLFALAEAAGGAVTEEMVGRAYSAFINGKVMDPTDTRARLGNALRAAITATSGGGSELLPRFQIACRALIRERKVYGEDLETLGDILRLLESVAESAGGARVGQEALDADELELFRQTVADFEDCEETNTDYDTLMRWAEMGLLACERFTITQKGYAAAAAPTPETPR